ncbi:uncharacterized protein LOC111192972 [Astyanax mexicanus]|uniref:uncharacterized protein LOC111192972 n=1 Tax=Astyanax mexicanus TaxID=7994 RepID=UPI0020CAAB7E|nr:uncharacterized protein LOC111192972 [Astyanax mexicanus]
MLDLSLCSELMDAEGRTGQKNALFIITLEQEIFIRGDSKEIINGWSEQLIVFQKKQNDRKKSEVSSVQFQEKVQREEAECNSGASDMEAVVYRDSCRAEHAVDLSTARDDDDDNNDDDEEDEDAEDEDSLVLETVKNHRFCQQSCSVDSEQDSAPPSPEPCGTDPDPFCLDSSLPCSASSLSGSSSSDDWELDEGPEITADLQQDSCSTNSSMIDGDGVLVSKVCQCCRRRGRSRSQTCTITNYKVQLITINDSHTDQHKTYKHCKTNEKQLNVDLQVKLKGFNKKYPMKRSGLTTIFLQNVLISAAQW